MKTKFLRIILPIGHGSPARSSARLDWFRQGWHPALELWGGTQFQNRFKRLTGRIMRPLDYDAWVATRTIGEAASRKQTSDFKTLRDFMHSPNFDVAAFKGVATSFRPGTASCASRSLSRHRSCSSAFRRNRASFTSSACSTRSASISRKPSVKPIRNDPIYACRPSPQFAETFPFGDQNVATFTASARAGISRDCYFLRDASERYTAYVTNEKDNSLSVIDTDKLEVIKTVKIGQRPRGIVMSNDGKWLIICTSDDNDVKVYDAQTLQYVKSLPSGPDPELLTLHPDGKRVYIANEDDNLVTVVDLESNKVITEIPVGVEPEGMGMSPDGKVLVNTSETTNMAHFIDTTTHKTFDNVLVDSRPRVAMFNQAQTQLWVSSEVGGTVAVINPADRKIITKINFEIPGVEKESIQPVGIRITKDDKIAFIALGPANRVAVVDTSTFKVLKYILVGQRVWQMYFTPDGKLLFTTNGASNDVSVIDVANQKAIKSIKVGRYPWGVVVSPK